MAQQQPIPFSQEAEEALIGALLLSPKGLFEVSQILSPDDFFLKRHEYVFRAMMEIYNEGSAVDYVSVSEKLRARGNLDEIGGQAFLTYCVNNTPSSVHGITYAKIVDVSARRREGLMLTDYMRGYFLDEETALSKSLPTMVDSLTELALQSSSLSSLHTISDSMSGTYDLIEERVRLHAQNPNYVIGIRTGLTLLDRLLDGIRKQDVTIFSGGTGLGKTSLILSILVFASEQGIYNTERRGAKIIVFSGEMSRDTLNMRLISMVSGVQFKKIERGNMSDKELIKYNQAVADLSNLEIKEWDGERADMKEVERVVKLATVQGGVDMIILDGINQLDSTDSNSDAPDHIIVSRIMNDAERIARDHDLAVVATHQINRTSYDKEPTLASLGRSSSIEQKAARVVFIFEPEVDNAASGGVKRMCKVAKNRHGETAIFPLWFQKSHTKYMDYFKAPPAPKTRTEKSDHWSGSD